MRARGPMDAIVTKIVLAAGKLSAHVDGTVDATHEARDVRVDARAPPMQPMPGIGWQAVAIDATAKGPFTAPNAAGTVNILGIEAPGTKVAAIAAKVSGNAGHVALDATVTGLSIPGPRPDLFAAAPVRIEATAELQPAAKPITLHLSHPLLDVQGHGTVGPWSVESPALIRYGQLTSDEFFVTATAAREGVIIRNPSSTDPLVMLKHFGPGNPELKLPC